MRAIVYQKYGLTNVLHLTELPLPVPKANEVLIRIHAASVNSWDWDLLRGKPFIVRLAGGGIIKPKLPVLGADVAGVVESVGQKVKQFKCGDAVFGDLSSARWGGFAEFVSVPENLLTLKPPNVSFEQAAALPQAGVMAWQGIHDFRKLQTGQKVLINGAAGGVGTYAVQLAKMLGAEVTAVDRGDKLEILKLLGADHVIDYTMKDFTQTGDQYDLVLDVVARRSLADYKRALLPGGVCVLIGGSTSTILQFMFFRTLASMTDSRKLRILMHQPNKDLTVLMDLLRAGRIKSIIHKCFPLSQVPEALQCIGNGEAIGKIIVQVPL
ncbi:NAD(P)-dependent alcohol dehydrogenase [Chryseolinea sp. H1M3-3]|uniref:NAD(P)-dependent alcohol dehydrogenase n=1 Tax=Chryseolinea sp. H1M3-3 TaxID=3034144 RepID=UPI0023EAD6A3|nr:NAD(P)-dependent alcohol dehydrogenase [Chryseolinea sp. H1M3-3]